MKLIYFLKTKTVYQYFDLYKTNTSSTNKMRTKYFYLMKNYHYHIQFLEEIFILYYVNI